MLFAHLKRILRLDRLRLRGPSGAKDEFLLAATAQNLRKLAKLTPLRRRSSPREAKRPHSAALIVVATAIRSPRPSGFFNTIFKERVVGGDSSGSALRRGKELKQLPEDDSPIG
jgi:hypothetical protein